MDELKADLDRKIDAHRQSRAMEDQEEAPSPAENGALTDRLLDRLSRDGSGGVRLWPAAHQWKARVEPAGGGLFQGSGGSPRAALAAVERQLAEERGSPGLEPPVEALERERSSILPLVRNVEALLFRKILSWLEEEGYRRVASELRQTFDREGILQGRRNGHT